MVPFCLTPEQNGSLLFNTGTKDFLLFNKGTKLFRFMASETKDFFFSISFQLSKQIVLISVPFWVERFFCIQKEYLFPFSSTALVERGPPCSFV